MFDLITDNPIFTRELRRRLRGRVMIYATNGFILMMCLVTAFILTNDSFFGGLEPSSDTGQHLFSVITAIQMILVLCIAPVLTAGMATVERERKTFEFLKVTTLEPLAFVVGGLMSTMLYVLVVLVCALPLLCISFLYGGVAPAQIIASFLKLLSASLVLSAAGLWISSTSLRTKNAQASTLVLALVAFLVGVSNQRALMGASLGKGTVALFNLSTLSVPVWLLVLGTGFIVSVALLLIAARKLYVPDNRPLRYRQSLLLLVIALTLYFGATWGRPTLEAAYDWMAWSYAILSLVVVTHCLHTLEVGNEVWGIKKRFPMWRFIDESILHVFLLTGLWAVTSIAWARYVDPALQSAAAAGAPLTPSVVTGGPLVSRLGSFLFAPFAALSASLIALSIFARFWGHYAPHRADAARKTYTTAAILMFAVPLAGVVAFRSTGPDSWPIVGPIIMLCPWATWQTLYLGEVTMVPLKDLLGTTIDAGSFERALYSSAGIWAVLTVLTAVYYYRRFVVTRPAVDYSYALTA